MLHQRAESCSSKTSQASSRSSTMADTASVSDFILLTPYPVEPGHTLITIMRISPQDFRPEMRATAAFVAEGENSGIIINKPASIMDYNKIQASQKERQQPPSAKMSFKVFLINSETGKLTLEHRTLRFWLDHSAVIRASGKQVNKHNGLYNSGNHGLDLGDADCDDGASTPMKSARSFANLKQESSQLAQAYFCQLIGSKSDDFPKNYVGFIMKLMRQLKASQFSRIIKMEVELRQLMQEEQPPSPASSIDGSQGGDSGRGSPLTTQKVLDIIESFYPNPISIKEICSTTQSDVTIVKQLVNELAQKEKINSTDDGQHFTRTLKPTTDTKIQMVKQMPKVQRSQQPVIAIITAQYCEKLAVDSMISDKETFVRYRITTGQQSAPTDSSDGNPSQVASSNYVYTLGNIGDHRVVSTKLTSIGHSRGALIAAGNATTRLLGTFPEIEYVFLVGCGGSVPNYTDFSSHVRLGDIVVSHLPSSSESSSPPTSNNSANQSSENVAANLSLHQNRGSAATISNRTSPNDYVYVHCRPKLPDQQQAGLNRTSSAVTNQAGASLPVSYSIHKNLKRLAEPTANESLASNGTIDTANCDKPVEAHNPTTPTSTTATPNAKLTYDECHFRLWRPARLDLQHLAQSLWLQGLDNAKHRIWDYYIDEGIKALQQQEVDASRPAAETDKLFMSIGLNDAIEVSHPEPGDDELDLRSEGRPMCHFGPIGSGKPALGSEPLKQQMISQFGLRAFDSEFDPVVESIYGNCKESYIMIRGISDYKDGRKKKEWQQYSALVAAAFMKSIIVNLKPLG